MTGYVFVKVKHKEVESGYDFRAHTLWPGPNTSTIFWRHSLCLESWQLNSCVAFLAHTMTHTEGSMSTLLNQSSDTQAQTAYEEAISSHLLENMLLLKPTTNVFEIKMTAQSAGLATISGSRKRNFLICAPLENYLPMFFLNCEDLNRYFCQEWSSLGDQWLLVN